MTYTFQTPCRLREFVFLVGDHPCDLELIRVNIEESASEGPPLELWECPMGHRTHYVSKEEGSITRAERQGLLGPG